LSTAAAVVLVAVGVAVAIQESRQRIAKRVESLAVLPLENLSHDPEQDYFAEGMTDELITDLAKISALRVISRTSVMQYKGTKKPVPQIARELNVDAVLEGTMTRDRDRVRITAQLIRAAPEKHLWAETYEAGLSGVLTVQDAVAKAVAQAIQIKVTPRERSLLATTREIDPAAYEAYLKGRYFLGARLQWVCRNFRLRARWRCKLSGREPGEKPGVLRAGDPNEPQLRPGMGGAGGHLQLFGELGRGFPPGCTPASQGRCREGTRTKQQPRRAPRHARACENKLRVGLGRR
jgi:TolB-like protein